MPTVKFKEGTVSFKVKQFHGCCGIGVVYHPRFTVVIEKRSYPSYGGTIYHVPHALRKTFLNKLNNLFVEFHKYMAGPRKLDHNQIPIKEWPFDLDRSRLMMTDHSGGDVYKFCTFNKWKKVKTFKNYNTNNILYTFYLDRRELFPSSVV